jgi:serine protease Do
MRFFKILTFSVLTILAASLIVNATSLMPSIGEVSDSITTNSNIRSLEQEIMKISENATKSVASIKTERTLKGREHFDPFFEFFRQFGFRGQPRQPYNPNRQSMGTGFVIDAKEGFVVTNNHVIESADKIEVIINGKTYDGEMIGTDPQTDIGLIKIKGFKKGEIEELKFADSDKIKVGSFAIAVGNPFGLSQTVTFGIVSAKGRSGMNVTEYEDFIQTDAAINPGNSGGPLMNTNGEVIGMNTAIFSKSGGYMGIGFAVPSNMVKAITNQLKDGKDIRRAQMGVTIQDLNDGLREHLGLDKNLQGVLISSAAKGSPAEKAGIKQGDVVTKFDGKVVDSVSRLRNLVAFSPFNKKIAVEIVRNGKKIKKSLVLSKDFKFEMSQTDGVLMQGDLGITLAAQKNRVVVTEVEQGSLAASAGILPDDIIVAVNQKRVKTVEEVNAIISKSKSVLLLINRKGREFFVVINK